MSETTTLEQTATQVDQEQVVQASPDANQIMAESLWGLNPTAYQNVQPVVTPQPVTEVVAEPVETAKPEEQDEFISADEYFKREYGLEASEFRSKWDELNKPKEPTQQEIQWANDESKRFFDYLKEGKEDDIYNFLSQKKQLERLEKFDVTDANQAAEIIRANLQFKYKDLSTPEIDRLFNRQYSLPAKPEQTIGQEDDEYAATLAQWQQQVQEKQQDMIIDAKLAKPELSKFKSEIVLPDIQKPQVQQTGPTQEELAAIEAGRKAYLGAVESKYQGFKGYNITAKDGDVQLPVSYNISPEELTASKQILENLEVNEFLGPRWFDGNNNPNVNLIQEDLYLLQNREKVFQKIANEAAAQMKAHLIKTQNNINLKGVSPTLGPINPNQPAPVNESQALAEKIWSM
jgi:hypothetical protein